MAVAGGKAAEGDDRQEEKNAFRSLPTCHALETLTGRGQIDADDGIHEEVHCNGHSPEKYQGSESDNTA